MKILLVEDDPSIGQILSNTLIAYRYIVDIATDGQTGLDLALQGEYDAILLDVMVPKLDGLTVCRQLRQQGYQTPILMLTVKDSAEDIVTGLNAGADDYVTKPCEPSQLIARVRALLRRHGSAMVSPVLTWGALCLDPSLIQVTYRQQVVSLSPKEYSLLELFLRHPQRIFSRSSIIDHLWSIDDSPTDAAVTNLIKDLRRKLKTAGMTEELIETVYRLGYRLKAAPKEPNPITDHHQERHHEERHHEERHHEEREKRRLAHEEGSALINQVAQNFQASLAERIEVLERAIQPLQANNLHSEQRSQLREVAHRLAGGLGTFGYARGSTLARSIECLLSQEIQFNEPQFRQFTQWLTELKQEIARPAVPPQPALPPPIAIASEAFVLMIDDDESFINALQEAAPIRGLRIEVMTDEALIWEQLEQNPPDIILLNLHYAATPKAITPDTLLSDTLPSGAGTITSENKLSLENRLSLLRALKTQFPEIPVLTLAEHDQLNDRITVARLGSERYILKPASPDEVFEAIAQVLPQGSETEAKVLVVDDDAGMLKMLTALLQPWGLQVTTLSNPNQFWQVLTSTNPDVLLLDLEMPTFNGIELCQVVRQDSKYGDLPILVVTAHTNIDDIQQVFAAGADDFVGKPIVGPELVSRLMSRIERSRMQRQLLRFQREQFQTWQQRSTLDSLTQVANRRHFDEYLKREWHRLSREHAPLALILCDIDQFKTYNDRNGHQAGDDCLQQLAQIICNCIDPNRDLVARFGSDEFAIVLPNTSLNNALLIAEQIRQAIHATFAVNHDFDKTLIAAPAQNLTKTTIDPHANAQVAQVPSTHPSTHSSVTVSLGITGTVPVDYQFPSDLIAIADQALYAAKARGGNTYCLHPL